MSRRLNKADAIAIAKKLDAEIETGSSHDLAKIYHDGKLISQYGIRRGSKKDLPHDYISDQIFMSKRNCISLSDCTKSKDDWIADLTAKGQI